MWRAWPGKAKFQDHAERKSESPSVFEWVLGEVKYVAAHVQKKGGGEIKYDSCNPQQSQSGLK